MSTAIATRSRKVQAQKVVLILHRYFVLATQSVVYHIRNGENREYYVTLNQNGTSGCVQTNGEPCPSTRGSHKCYHITECQKAEQERTARKLIASTVETVETAKFRTLSYGVSSKGAFIQEYRDGGWYKMCDMNGDEVIVNRELANDFIEELHECAATGPVYVVRDYTRTGYSVKCDAMVNAIRDGQIVECLWSRLSESERSEARANSGY